VVSRLRETNILDDDNVAILSAFASSNVLLAFDYDGTLAPVVATPSRARMRRRTRRLLIAVARRYPCVVISGRATDDVQSRVERVPLSRVFGNHGFEPWAQGEHFAATVREWVRQLRARLGRRLGVKIEDKTYSVAIHYRQARRKPSARRAIAAAVRSLRDVRVLGGDEAVNLIVRGAADKGTALQHARRAFACDTAIYVGNDDTDEDAFASAAPDQLLSIRIGRSDSSAARYYLESQPQMDRLLELLVTFRSSATMQRKRREVAVRRWGNRGSAIAATPEPSPPVRASARRRRAR
jgi:trehalose 6-phosphate phosphatase